MSTPTQTSNALSLEQVLRLAQELPRILEILRSLGSLFGFGSKKPPVVVPADAPAAPPVVVPNAPPIPQIPVPVKAKVASVRTVVQGVERPERVGGGPGVNYDDHRGMIARGEAFNFGCVAFLDSTAFDAAGDEFTGGSQGKLVRNDLEFRGKYRVYRDGALIAFIEGAGDDNPTGEGQARPWHQSASGAVNFGQGKWMASAGMGVRIVFVEEGSYEIEFELDGVMPPRIPFRVS